MRDEELKTILAWVLEADIAEEPKASFMSPLKYIAKCPKCDMPITPNQDRTVDDKVVYLPVSFCPRCGTPIDWTGVISKDELGELEEVE